MQADRMGLCSYVALQHRLKDWCNPCKFISIYQLPVCGYTAPSPPFLARLPPWSKDLSLN